MIILSCDSSKLNVIKTHDNSLETGKQIPTLICFRILSADFLVVGIKYGTGIGTGIGRGYGCGMLYMAMGTGM